MCLSHRAYKNDMINAMMVTLIYKESPYVQYKDHWGQRQAMKCGRRCIIQQSPFSMKLPKHSDCIISFTGTSSYMWWWSKKNRNSSWSLIHKYQKYKDQQWAVPVLRMFTSWEVESPKWRWLSFSALGKILTLLGVLFLGLHLDHWISYYLYLYFGEISTCWEFF